MNNQDIFTLASEKGTPVEKHDMATIQDALMNSNMIEISLKQFRQIIAEGVSLELSGLLDEYELNLESIQEDYYDEIISEAEYRGREVKLGKPMKGDVSKFKVYVKDKKTGNVKKVNFGDPNMEIRRDNPKARKSFRARHGCGTGRASDRTKAAFWSCKMWSKKPVSKILKGK